MPGIIETPEIIITEEDKSRIFIFSTGKQPAHVIEVPATRFEGFPVCLGTAVAAELPKLKYMSFRLAQVWQQLLENSSGILRS